MATEQRLGFESAYREGRPPWDIGRPQSAVVELAQRGVFQGEVLDAGCGTGENALFLASRGLAVTGIDAAPTAIARARQKAMERELPALFEVADALDLQTLGRTFDAIVDCGLFHVFGDDDRRRYERSLHAALRSNGRYALLCFSDEQPGSMGPRRISQAEIRNTFASGWTVDSVAATRFDTLMPMDGEERPMAWVALLTRL
jgi:cyclopropane fatty-acyl-phospholipid synthase-like methyltransferase